MVDQTDLDARRGARSGRETKLVWVETPTNPTLKVIDVAGRGRARRGGAFVAVDNTFATPVHQRPLELGADAVVHSTTKYLGGHSDAVGGAVVVRDPALHERVRFVQNSIGAVPGPLDCFLVHRGLRTLHLRMAAHTENARVVVGVAARGIDGRLRRPLARASAAWSRFRHPDAVGIVSRDADVLAGRVARRRGVADRGPAGDDAPVRRGLGAPRCRPTSCGCRAGSRRAEDLVEDLAQAIGVSRAAVAADVMVGGNPYVHDTLGDAAF